MAQQGTLAPVSAVPGGAPEAMTEGTVVKMTALSLLRVRLRLVNGAGAAVAVRPWYYRDGNWWPLRGDGAGAGPGPVTATPGVLQDASGRALAEGLYVAAGLSHSLCLVVESGNASDVSTALVEAADLPTLS